MQIHLVQNKDGIKEWAILELQGTLEFGGSLPDQFIGNLVWIGKTAYLIITHNILEGKETKLEKPLVVLSKNPESDTGQLVKAIVRRKIVFRSRPKPLVLQGLKDY